MAGMRQEDHYSFLLFFYPHTKNDAENGETHSGNGDQSSFKGAFFYYPEQSEIPLFLTKLLTDNYITIIRDEHLNLPKVANLESLLRFYHSDEFFTMTTEELCCAPLNVEFVERLFKKSRLKMSGSYMFDRYFERFATAPISADNLRPLKSLLAARPDLPYRGVEDGSTLLCFAVESGQQALFELLLEHGADVKIRSNFGSTLIHFAIKGKKPTETRMWFIRRLVKEGLKENISVADKNGNTPLHLATIEETVEVSEYLLQLGAEINAVTSTGMTALQLATESGQQELFELFLKHGADIHVKSQDNSTLLHSAVKSIKIGSYEKEKKPIKVRTRMIDVLVKKGLAACINAADINGYTPLHLAAIAKNGTVVADLLKRGADVNAATKTGMTALHFAAEGGATADRVSQLLLRSGADVHARDADGTTPLIKALAKAPRVLKILVEHGAAIDARTNSGQTILYNCVKENWHDSVSYILSLRPNAQINAGVLSLALQKSSFPRETIRAMLLQGFTVSAEEARTPGVLHGAVYHDLSDLVRKLLDSGADINLSHSWENNKLTPLRIAVKYSKVAALELLIERGADLSVGEKAADNCNVSNLTAYTDLLVKGNVKIAKILFRARAPAPTDSYLLHSAISRQHIELVKLLLQHGLDPNGISDKGTGKLPFPSKTCISKSLRKNKSIVNSLIRFGAVCCLDDLSKANSKPFILDTFYIFLNHVFSGGMSGETRKVIVELLAHSRNEFVNSGCQRLLVHHLMKLDALQPETMNPVVRGCVRANDVHFAFQKTCKAEVERMKENVADTSLSFCDLLTEDVQCLRRFPRNPKVLSAIKSDVERRFPIYSGMLLAKFQILARMRKLTEINFRILTSVFSQFASRIPGDVVDIIICYLSYRDLTVILITFLNSRRLVTNQQHTDGS